MKKTGWHLIFVFAALVLFASCELEEYDTTAQRVLLVYMVGDNNNLDGECYDKTEAIMNGFHASSCNKLLIYTDDGYSTSLVEVIKKNGINTKRHVSTYSNETNSADPAVLKKIINEVKAKFPAESYGFILFSHGTGWLPKGGYSNPRTIFQDKGKEMELPDFADAIPNGMFDYIVIEACLMSGIEVAYELKDKADYIVASSAEIISPGFLYAYRHGMDYLFSSTPDLVKFTKLAFDDLNRTHASATFSIIRTKGLDDLTAFIRNNCQWGESVNFEQIQDFGQSKYRNLFFDFENFYSQLLPNEQLKNELSTLIDNCLVEKMATDYLFGNYFNRIKINHHSGFTTYIPRSNLYDYLNGQYMGTKWYTAILFNNSKSNE